LNGSVAHLTLRFRPDKTTWFAGGVDAMVISIGHHVVQADSLWHFLSCGELLGVCWCMCGRVCRASKGQVLWAMCLQSRIRVPICERRFLERSGLFLGLCAVIGPASFAAYSDLHGQFGKAKQSLQVGVRSG